MQLILLNEGTFRSRKLSVSAHVCPRIVSLKRRSLVKFLVNFTFFWLSFWSVWLKFCFLGMVRKVSSQCTNKLPKLFMAVKTDVQGTLFHTGCCGRLTGEKAWNNPSSLCRFWTLCVTDRVNGYLDRSSYL